MKIAVTKKRTEFEIQAETLVLLRTVLGDGYICLTGLAGGGAMEHREIGRIEMTYKVEFVRNVSNIFLTDMKERLENSTLMDRLAGHPRQNPPAFLFQGDDIVAVADVIIL